MSRSRIRPTATAALKRRRTIGGAAGLQEFVDDGLRAGPDRAGIEAARQRRQQADIGQRRKASADAGMMIERRNAEVFAHLPQRIDHAIPRRFGQPEEQPLDVAFEPALLHGAERRHHLHQRFRRAARFRDDDEAAVLDIEAGERALQGAGVEVVVKARARSLALLRPGIAGNVPARQLRQRLPAETRAACSQEDHRLGAADQPLIGGFRVGEVGCRARNPQQWQRTIFVLRPQPLDMRLGAPQPEFQLGRRQPRRADGLRQAPLDRQSIRQPAARPARCAVWPSGMPVSKRAWLTFL